MLRDSLHGRPRLARQMLFLAILVLFAGADACFGSPETPFLPLKAAYYVTISLSLIYAGLVGRAGALLNIILCLVVVVLPTDVILSGMLSSTMYVSAAYLYSTSSWVAPTVAVSVPVLESWIGHPDDPSSWAPYIFLALLTACLGVGTRMVLREAHLDALRAAQVTAMAERDHQAMRDEISSLLHDTVSAGLARIRIGTQLALSSPTQEERSTALHEVLETATATTNSLHSMMRFLDEAKPDDPHTELLTETVRQCAQMLRTRGITLHVQDTETTLETLQERPESNLVARMIRECSVNALKYAPAESEASLIIEDVQTAGHTAVLFSSAMPRDEGTATVPSTGMGLRYLSSRIKTDGGTLDAGPVGGAWVVAATFPSTRSVP